MHSKKYTIIQPPPPVEMDVFLFFLFFEIVRDCKNLPIWALIVKGEDLGIVLSYTQRKVGDKGRKAPDVLSFQNRRPYVTSNCLLKLLKCACIS